MKTKNMFKTHFRVWLIDPAEKTVNPRFLDKKTKEFTLDVQRMTQAGVVGHNKVGDVGNFGLHVAGDAEAPKGQGGFRFEGFDCEPTSGKAVLFGSSSIQDQVRLMQAPVDLEWIQKHLVWTDAAETDGVEVDG